MYVCTYLHPCETIATLLGTRSCPVKMLPKETYELVHETLLKGTPAAITAHSCQCHLQPRLHPYTAYIAGHSSMVTVDSLSPPPSLPTLAIVQSSNMQHTNPISVPEKGVSEAVRSTCEQRGFSLTHPPFHVIGSYRVG